MSQTSSVGPIERDHDAFEAKWVKNDRKVTLIIIGWLSAFVVLPFLWWLLIEPSFVSDSVAYRTAEGSGFTHVELLSREQPLAPAWSGCSGSDLIKFTMSGINPAGDETVFTVCASPGGSGTIHF